MRICKSPKRQVGSTSRKLFYAGGWDKRIMKYGFKFGTNSCCTLFNLLVCFDAEGKTPYVPLTKFHKMTMEFSQLK